MSIRVSETEEALPLENASQEERLQEQIRLANYQQYHGGEEVEMYMQKPYHKLRLSLTLQLLINEIIQIFPVMQTKDIKILEMGSATGQTAIKLAEKGYEVIASDIELIVLSEAIDAGICCIQLDASQPFPLEDGSVNVIVICELIEHLFNTEHLLSECNRVLCNGGLLIITTPNLATLQDRFLFLFGYAPRHVNPFHRYLKLHIRPFTYDLLKEVLWVSGFSVRKVLSNYVTMDLPREKVIMSRLLARLFPKMGGTLIVSAQKRGSSLPKHENTISQRRKSEDERHFFLRSGVDR